MQRYSIREVLEMAIQTEKLGNEFYSTMAERFADSKGLSDLFTRLANMEVRHEATFKDMVDRLGAEEKDIEGLEDVQSYMRAAVESEFFMGKGKALPSLERVRSVAEAADFALSFEKATILFFIGLRAAVANKQLVDDVIEEETTHVAWLSSFKESL